MRCLLINNDGAGFADYIEVAEGTTVEKLFAERIPHGKPAGLPDPRQSPARRLRPGPAGRRPREHHAHQDRRLPPSRC